MKKLVFPVITVFFLALSLVFVSCDDGDNPPSEGVQLSESAKKLDDELAAVINIPGEHTIELTENVIDYPGIVLETPGVKITLNGNGKTISWKYTSARKVPMFLVKGTDLILENVTLTCASGNTQKQVLILINSGSVEMKAEVTLDNDYNDNGVWLKGGSFIMSGGEIKNSQIGIGANADGVSITMSGGLVTGCTKDSVWVSGAVTFVMSGGTITGGDRSGICAAGSGAVITVTGGTINSNYHGIGLWENCMNVTLNVEGGNIKDNTESGIAVMGDRKTVNVTGGTISGNREGIALWSATNTSLTINGAIIKDSNDKGENHSVELTYANNGWLAFNGNVASSQQLSLTIDDKGNITKKEGWD